MHQKPLYKRRHYEIEVESCNKRCESDEHRHDEFKTLRGTLGRFLHGSRSNGFLCWRIVLEGIPLLGEPEGEEACEEGIDAECNEYLGERQKVWLEIGK